MAEGKETKTDKDLGQVDTSASTAWLDSYMVTGSAGMYSQGTTISNLKMNQYATTGYVFSEQQLPTNEIKEVFSTVVDGNHYGLVKDPQGFTLLKNDNIEYLYTEQDLIRIFLDFNTKEVMKDCDKLLKLL